MKTRAPISVLAAAVAIATLSACHSNSSNPNAKRTVIMGDSYSSGEGTHSTGSFDSVDYYPDTATQLGDPNEDECHRSDGAWGPIVSNDGALPYGYRLDTSPGKDFVACSGARSWEMIDGYRDQKAVPSDHEQPQVATLDHRVGTVILTAGGDDVGFPYVLDQCIDIPVVHSHSDVDCTNAIDLGQSLLGQTEQSVQRLLNEIEHRTDGARIIYVGYPRLFPEGGCFGGGNGMTQDKQKEINSATDELVPALLASGSKVSHNVHTIDVRGNTATLDGNEMSGVEGFNNHNVCGFPPWGHWLTDLQTNIPGLSANCPRSADQNPDAQNPSSGSPVCTQSFHPNPDGYKQYAKIIEAALKRLGEEPAPPSSSTIPSTSTTTTVTTTTTTASTVPPHGSTTATFDVSGSDTDRYDGAANCGTGGGLGDYGVSASGGPRTADITVALYGFHGPGTYPFDNYFRVASANLPPTHSYAWVSNGVEGPYVSQPGGGTVTLSADGSGSLDGTLEVSPQPIPPRQVHVQGQWGPCS